MNRLLGLVPALVVIALSVDSAAAITIDDFTVGAVSLTGPTGPTDYSGLDPTHVLGGERRIKVGNPPTVGNTLDIGVHRLAFASGGSYGYFQLTYGAAQPLGADLTAGGHDRLRVLVTQVVGPAPSLGQMTVYDAASHGKVYSLGAGLTALNGTSGYLEFQLTGFAIDPTDISKIFIDFARYPTDGSFQIQSIATAGPPIPGDYNRNGIVDVKDYFTWKDQYGAALSGLQTSGVILSADGNGDGKVDALDYSFWRNESSGGAGGVASVPEPANPAVALVAGLILLTWFRTSKYCCIAGIAS